MEWTSEKFFNYSPEVDPIESKYLCPTCVLEIITIVHLHRNEKQLKLHSVFVYKCTAKY